MTDYNKGGTWTGAIENLKNSWTKLLVWHHKEYDGNFKLIEKGAIPFALSREKLYDIITRREDSYDQLDIFKALSIVSEKQGEYNTNED